MVEQQPRTPGTLCAVPPSTPCSSPVHTSFSCSRPQPSPWGLPTRVRCCHFRVSGLLGALSAPTPSPPCPGVDLRHLAYGTPRRQARLPPPDQSPAQKVLLSAPVLTSFLWPAVVSFSPFFPAIQIKSLVQGPTSSCNLPEACLGCPDPLPQVCCRNSHMPCPAPDTPPFNRDHRPHQAPDLPLGKGEGGIRILWVVSLLKERYESI